MSRGGARGDRNVSARFYAGAVVIVLAAAVAVTAYSVELGLARPSVNTRRIVIAVAEVDGALERGADFRQYSEALYAGLVARRSLAVRNPADSRVNRALIGALDCYSALRESWQTELEGDWDPSLHGDPAYWRSFHPAIDLADAGPLTVAGLRTALRAEARAYLDDALAVVER
ncbi:MAG: hypothetical protein RQ731_02575 [Anaerosomatales bacterium]|nr:hypothetical protein [Anaerosomatales bacterium]MDT8433628.1 hypothetical protein [Anaerosomatales bacterium]